MIKNEQDNVIYHLHRHKKLLVVHAIVLVVLTIIFVVLCFIGLDALALQKKGDFNRKPPTSVTFATTTTATGSLMFDVDATIEETGSFAEKGDSVFWLSSGGRLKIVDKVATTIFGDLPASDKWYLIYKTSNPIDSDAGLHPQNIFRLVTRSDWNNFTQEMYFNLLKLNKSTSLNRNASNGVLFFSRYIDAQNLYYAGIRVDGTVVIKKKKAGVYYTLAQTKILPGVYNLETNPNLIPLNTWQGMRLVSKTIGTQVQLTFFIDQGSGVGFVKVLEALDDGSTNGGVAFTAPGKAGIRTDFFDLSMKGYTISKN